MKIDMAKVSQVLGHSIGTDFRNRSFDIDVEGFIASFKNAFDGKPPKMPAGEMQQVMMAFQNDLKEKEMAEKGAAVEKNLKAGSAFLEQNRSKEDVFETDSGLQYRVITKGDGDTPSASNTVTTHYEGRTIDGKIFDSSIKRGQPASFPVNGVIKGWQEALQMMPVGSKWELFVPSDLAYGQAGSGAAIGPNETLIFDVELIAIK